MSQPLQPPFEAYDGDEPFLFASYSHTDSAAVYPELARLHALGYRIWYDEGIVPTSEWPEAVAEALEKCSFFLVFISPRAAGSRNVRNEVNYAVRQNKPFLAVHLEETTLPKGLELQIGSIHAILRCQMTEERYRRQVDRALPVALRGIGAPVATPAPERVVAPSRPVVVGGEVITSSIGMTLRLTPSGSFLMGSCNGDPDEQPVGPVVIDKPFYVAVCQVTQEQYERVMSDKPSRFNGPNRPVERVSWHDAQEFCQRLSDIDGAAYRLPTEAEWEYACRAGSTTEYCFRKSHKPLEKYAWFSENSAGETHNVGNLKPNAWGLFDMHGNVWEWCQSLYGPYPYRAGDGRENVHAQGNRVLRGGSWTNVAGSCRCAYRHYLDPAARNDRVGFRAAMPLP